MPRKPSVPSLKNQKEFVRQFFANPKPGKVIPDFFAKLAKGAERDGEGVDLSVPRD